MIVMVTVRAVGKVIDVVLVIVRFHVAAYPFLRPKSRQIEELLYKLWVPADR